MIYLARFDIFLDIYTRKVFDGILSGFSKTESGEYLCGNDMLGSQKFGDGLEKFILSHVCEKNDDIFKRNYFFIIGDCRPYDNILLDLDHIKYRGNRVKYRLLEKDINIDTVSFNRRADYVFGRMFRRAVKMPSNVFFVSHIRLGTSTLKRFMN